MGAEQSGGELLTPEKELAPRRGKREARRTSSKATGGEKTIGELSTPEKRYGDKRGVHRSTTASSKVPVEAPKAKRRRSSRGGALEQAPAVAEEAPNEATEQNASCSAIAASTVQPELLRLEEPGAGHTNIQLTGHLPGEGRIPDWMQVYSSAGGNIHEDQPVYASQDGNFLLYHSLSGPGVGQGWWLGREAEGTEANAALAFLPRGHTQWWVLDGESPIQAEVLIITVSSVGLDGDLSAPSGHEDSSSVLNTRATAGLLRLAEPGAEHAVLQLSGHLPGEGRIPAWMQVYSSVGCSLHQGQPTYASQDGTYLLYNSSGPGVGQGWWLGRAADGTAARAALAFLPRGHQDWWVLDEDTPQQARVLITAMMPSTNDAAVSAAPMPQKDESPIKQQAERKDQASWQTSSHQQPERKENKRRSHAQTKPAPQPSAPSQDVEGLWTACFGEQQAQPVSESPSMRPPATPFSKDKKLDVSPLSSKSSTSLQSLACVQAISSLPSPPTGEPQAVVKPPVSEPTGASRRHVADPTPPNTLDGESQAAVKLAAPEPVVGSRTSTEATAAQKRSASSTGRSDSADKVARASGRSTGSAHSIDRAASLVGADANDIIERLARSTCRSGNTSRNIDSVDHAGRRVPSSDLQLRTAAFQQRHDLLSTASPAQPGSSAQLMVEGVCSRDLGLVIMPAEGSFLNHENLKKQEELLRSFEKLSLKLGPNRRGFLHSVQLVPSAVAVQ